MCPSSRSDKDESTRHPSPLRHPPRPREANADVLIIDTAGRLQNKSNLMDELGKIRRVTERTCRWMKWLPVLDATTGQKRHGPGQVYAGSHRHYRCGVQAVVPPRAAS